MHASRAVSSHLGLYFTLLLNLHTVKMSHFSHYTQLLSRKRTYFISKSASVSDFSVLPTFAPDVSNFSCPALRLVCTLYKQQLCLFRTFYSWTAKVSSMAVKGLKSTLAFYVTAVFSKAVTSRVAAYRASLCFYICDIFCGTE